MKKGDRSTGKMKIQLSDHFSYKRLFRFTLPTIGMMVFTSIYGVVDGLFISNFVGKTAFAAVNLIMPFVMIFGGVGFMLGTGGSALVGMTLGEQDQERADQYFTLLVRVTLVVGLIISAAGAIVIRPVSIMLGADEAMLEDCVIYGRITLGFAVTFILQNLFQEFLIVAEKPKMGFAVTVAAGVVNMVLDALFVAVFKWGVAGAAVATGLSQCAGGLIPLIYFLSPNSSKLRLTKARLEWRPILRSCVNGSSEMVSNVTASAVGMLYNFQLLKYAGQNGVAAYGVLMYVQFIFAAVFIGYSIGCAPVVSFHYGAQNHGELKSLLRKSLISIGAAGCGMLLTAQLCAVPLGRIFVGYDQALLDMMVHAFRISSLSFILMGFNIFASAFFTALNDGAISALISFLRTFVFKMSAVLLLPMVLELDGIWWAEAVAEAGAGVISIVFLIALRKKYHYL